MYQKRFDRSRDTWDVYKMTGDNEEWLATVETETMADGMLAFLNQDLPALTALVNNTPQKQKVRVWTEAYSPFIFGGDVNQPIATDLELGPPIKLTDTASVYEVVSPSGRTHYAEVQSGAFVGVHLPDVKKDIETGDPSIIPKQIAAAIERRKKAKVLTPEAFWARFRDERVDAAKKPVKPKKGNKKK